MSELFRNILNVSVLGSIVIAVVLMLRPLLWKAPKKYLCILWATALALAAVTVVAVCLLTNPI